MSDLAASTGLPAHAVQAIQQVLAACPAVEQAVLYGSRAKGNYKRGSDIDLTLKAFHYTQVFSLFRSMACAA
ncbi:nucleotidyltransferase domain-containing protein, partial [Malikia spinosa]|uniref:nucleotidyltransferase domain-containing protein n=1 Tax=Malikia spinosa TaxID=86180 RepID=UPI003FA1E586